MARAASSAVRTDTSATPWGEGSGGRRQGHLGLRGRKREAPGPLVPSGAATINASPPKDRIARRPSSTEG